MKFIQLFSDVRARPNAYGLNGSFRELVAFVNGCNAATGTDLLHGFSRRMAIRLGWGENLYWALLVANIALPSARVQSLDNLGRQYDERLTAVLFDELLDFLSSAPGERSS
ncbi:hypothetical protein GTY54_29165 [Streptomyces sp. SID625]|nr:hypothetical protein [Streptomyces sp. SID625]